MKKGISTWLMTKVVMLMFLTVTFGIIISFTGLIQQRSMAESAQQISVRTKDSIQALLGIKAQTGTRKVVLPDQIPRDSGRSIRYTVHIFTTSSSGGNGPTVSVAVARGTYESDIPSGNYLSASSFTLPSGYTVSILPSGEAFLQSNATSSIVIEKTGETEFKISGE